MAPRLTLNLGVRWEAETGTVEAHDRLTYFNPQADNGTGFNGALEFTGGKNPRTIRKTNWKNFGPRLGFAYRVTNKTAVRGGFGIFYLPIGLENAIFRVDNGTFRLGNNANLVLRDRPNSYVQQWNFAVGQQLGKTTAIDVTYFGSRVSACQPIASS